MRQRASDEGSGTDDGVTVMVPPLKVAPVSEMLLPAASDRLVEG